MTRQLLCVVASVATGVLSGCFATAPTGRHLTIAELPPTIDSMGVAIRLPQPFQRPAEADTRLCFKIDTTAYVEIMKQPRRQAYAAIRPRRATDTGWVETPKLGPIVLDSTAIMIRVWAEEPDGTRVELDGWGSSGGAGTGPFLCYQGRPLRAGATYESLWLWSSKPFRTQRIIWEMVTG